MYRKNDIHVGSIELQVSINKEIYDTHVRRVKNLRELEVSFEELRANILKEIS